MSKSSKNGQNGKVTIHSSMRASLANKIKKYADQEGRTVSSFVAEEMKQAILSRERTSGVAESKVYK